MDTNERRKRAGQIAACYMKPVYGFALKKTNNLQDAEDLAQEICLKLYKVLLVKDDIVSTDKFIWAIAHNTLVNYYRDKSKSYYGNIEEFSEVIASGESLPDEQVIEDETVKKLQNEIAYLSKIQRRVVILYYYSGKKQSEIASVLEIPCGTVKWHLSEARNELKKGMENMRNVSELKFNPIHFSIMGLSGSTGTMGGAKNFLRSTLSQNIAYAVWKEGKTINEIADCLGVSPVYVESEADFLEKYGFLIKKGDKYLTNFLIDEPTTEQNKLHDEVFDSAARLIGNELFHELMKSDVINNEGIFYPDNDKNFLMWALLFYIAALSGEKLMDDSIKFEEAATIRPDGGQNIAYASVLNEDAEPPKYFESMGQWCGPCWNAIQDIKLWLIDSEWSSKRVDDKYGQNIGRDLNLLKRFSEGEALSEDEYAFMVQKGYIRKTGDRFEFSVVYIKDRETKEKLMAIGDKIKEKHNKELNELRNTYIKAVLDGTPKHLHKMQKYGLQFMFHSDGWFLLHCAKELVANGRLKLPTEEQKKSLTMLAIMK
jgi:RNA polymerase sigma factor (sigma-70 family)